MNNKTVLISGLAFISLIAGMFAFAYWQSQSTESENAEEMSDQNDTAVSSRFDYIDRITAKVFYLDGRYTFVGEIPMPTPCDLLVTDGTLRDNQINLDFSVINNAETCAQVVTAARFKIDVDGPQTADFHAHFEGRDVMLNLIPADPGETPENFEVFIKG